MVPPYDLNQFSGTLCWVVPNNVLIERAGFVFVIRYPEVLDTSSTRLGISAYFLFVSLIITHGFLRVFMAHLRSNIYPGSCYDGLMMKSSMEKMLWQLYNELL